MSATGRWFVEEMAKHDVDCALHDPENYRCTCGAGGPAAGPGPYWPWSAVCACCFGPATRIHQITGGYRCEKDAAAYRAGEDGRESGLF